MDVNIWFCLLIQIVIVKGQDAGKKSPSNKDEKVEKGKIDINFDLHNSKKPLEFLTKLKPAEHKDYFLPPVFPNNNEDDIEDGDEEEDNTYLDYEYDIKENNYRDVQEASTIKPDNSELLPFDSKFSLHSTKDNLPVFLLEPENTYVVKNKPATLKCRAANALEVYFKCNGMKATAMNFEFVDPHTGVRIVEGEYNVTREQVEEYFGGDKYQCSCIAWTSRGQIRSQAAIVDLAFIKKQFTLAPQSQVVKQYNQAVFRCEPPPAAPFSQLYWLKNGAPVLGDDNVQINKEGDLIIKQTSLLDMANYTCVAENIAGKRLSDSALLTVFVNGGWTTWSSWSDCSCVDTPSNGRRRTRTCTAPRPLNGGQPCLGPAVQKTQDCHDCDIDLYVDGIDELADSVPDVMLGRWSQWSDWSPCDSDCLHSRRRKCLVSSACLGKDYQIAQCPLCVRTSKSNLVNDTSHWPLLLAICVTLLIFVVVVILGLKYLKIKIKENSPYVKPSSGSNYFGSVIKRTLTNQPDLTIHEEFQTLGSPRYHQRHMSLSTNTQNRNEHLYEVPQLANSYITPLDQEVRHETQYVKNTKSAYKDNESEHSDSSCFLSSGSSYGNESIEISPSLKNNISFESKCSFGKSFDTITSKIMNSEGGWLHLDKCGVSLFVPDGALDKDERQLFSIEISEEEWNRPILQEGETQLSPVIRCGLKNIHFRKAVIISFPHSASLVDSSWLLSVLQKPEDINTRQWSKILTLGKECQGTPLFAQVDPGKVFIVCEFLSDFVLVGQSFTGVDAKILKVAVFTCKKLDSQSSRFTVRVRVYEDTPYALNDCVESERRIGGTLLCEPKTLYFQDSCSDLCFNLRDIGPGWKIYTGVKYQEIPFARVWNMNLRSIHCTFVIKQIDPTNCPELNLSVYQKQKQSNCVYFRLKMNDVICNYNAKRFSVTSIEKSYMVNIIENPFNYSSLDRRDGIAKNNTFCRQSYFDILDNNYEINVLNKIDKALLCKLLDVESPKGNDWRLLAEKLKIDNYYNFFSNTCSPTENILNLWFCRHNDCNMMINLIKIFREMSRIDCASIVERSTGT